MPTCRLESYPNHGGCCCQCKYRLRAFDHDSFLRRAQMGWACIAFAFMEGEDIAYIGEFEHGMCELYEARKGDGEKAVRQLKRGEDATTESEPPAR